MDERSIAGEQGNKDKSYKADTSRDEKRKFHFG
jgi:hypothetical protein